MKSFYCLLYRRTAVRLYHCLLLLLLATAPAFAQTTPNMEVCAGQGFMLTSKADAQSIDGSLTYTWKVSVDDGTPEPIPNSNTAALTIAAGIDEAGTYAYVRWVASDACPDGVPSNTFTVVVLAPAAMPTLTGSGLCSNNALLSCYGETGYSYQLQNDKLQSVGAPQQGANAQLNFPVTASGRYTVIITNKATNCTAASNEVIVPEIITLTASGTWTVPAGYTAIDVFAVGGGGAGAGAIHNYSGGGGGGGYTKTTYGIAVSEGETLEITIGAGGVPSTSNGGDGGASSIKRGTAVLASAEGGKGGIYGYKGGRSGGNGGSGGGAGVWDTRGINVKGGSDGSDGYAVNATGVAGIGQHTTTRCPFTNVLYAGGGGGFGYGDTTTSGTDGGEGGGGHGYCACSSTTRYGVSGTANTGGGGGAGYISSANETVGGTGGSGIIILVKHGTCPVNTP